MNNFYFGNFSSYWEKSKVILEFLFCPNSNWNSPKLEFWISNCFPQIDPLPLKIGSGSLNKICRVQNFEEFLFWPKFDFYSKWWSNLKKMKGGDKPCYSAPKGGDALQAAGGELRPVPPHAWPRRCLHAGPRQGVLIGSTLLVAWIKPRVAVNSLFPLWTSPSTATTQRRNSSLPWLLHPLDPTPSFAANSTTSWTPHRTL